MISHKFNVKNIKLILNENVIFFDLNIIFYKFLNKATFQHLFTIEFFVYIKKKVFQIIQKISLYFNC